MYILSVFLNDVGVLKWERSSCQRLPLMDLTVVNFHLILQLRLSLEDDFHFFYSPVDNTSFR